MSIRTPDHSHARWRRWFASSRIACMTGGSRPLGAYHIGELPYLFTVSWSAPLSDEQARLPKQ